MVSEELERRISDGDEQALDELITLLSPVISGTLYNFFGELLPQADIEEITADAFVKMWFRRENVQPGRLEGYLMTVAKNDARNRIRDNAVRDAEDISITVIEDDFVVSDGIEEQEAADALTDALDKLGKTDKELLIRHYYYGQTSTTIGESLHIAASSVRVRMKRAREKLKKILLEGGFLR